MKLIYKSALVAEIEKQRQLIFPKNTGEMKVADVPKPLEQGWLNALSWMKKTIDTLEVKDPYEQRVQYDSIKTGIKAHAETYSFNIKSELFNQLTKEQQKLWRKEIEQACISGGDAGYSLAKDPRYKENLKVKEVDLEKILIGFQNRYAYENGGELPSAIEIAKHFFELGMRVNNPITAADRGMVEEIIVNLKRVEQDYHIDLTREMEWVMNKVQKGEL